MKSDKAKLKEKRCLGEGPDYVGFIKANEAKSIGTATEIYDPIAERTVDVLSISEKWFYWITRYRDDVKEIQEQMVLNPEVVKEICEEYGFPIPTRYLSTDFLVNYTDGTSTAYSIKTDRQIFDKENMRYKKRNSAYENFLIRQFIEKEYWRRHGIIFRIIFGNELNTVLARNIRTCMGFYDRKYVTDTESKLKYLLAHKHIQIEMDKEPLNFVRLAKDMRDTIEYLYAGVTNNDGYKTAD